MSTAEASCSGAGFVHLHVHSEYSVLDGASRVADIIEQAKEYNMKAVALTDHGAMFGAIEFYEAAQAAGIKPIIGCELYLAKGRRDERQGRGSGTYHQLMLCENEVGYQNLCRLSSLGYLEGYYYKPRVDCELLARHSEGLIATSSCLSGEVPRLLQDGNMDKARASVQRFIDIFGKDNFLIELQDHGLPEQKKINAPLREIADDFGLVVIASNDSHYTKKEDAEAHDVLLTIQTGSTLDTPDRMKFSGSEFYFCSPEEMREKFPECPEAISNTEMIADRCNLELKLGQHLIPEYKPPEGQSKADYLSHLVQEGLVERFGDNAKEHEERAAFELGVIGDMGFVDYFLVVWDLINFAGENGIPVGPGRGSGAGSLVAYALKITNIDPIRYGLLFERFLNPERVSMPDFDIDFCYERRGEMIDYAQSTYGEDNVSQIITFGRMLAKNVIRNVGRVMGMPYDAVDRIAKLIPDELKITLESAQKKEPELARILKDDPEVAKLWSYAKQLEGTIGNCGTHAAGVIICDKPLTDFVPLFKAPQSDFPATQYEMSRAEQVGLLKMDFLGLRTLTVIDHAVAFVRDNCGIEIDINNLEPDDAKTYELLRSGKTTGIFQLESSGMRELSKRIGLQSLEEICALVALYRPGPMALKDDYIANKFNPAEIKYDHALLKPILEETYGIALYQEQVMQIAQAIAGFSLGQADILRRAMGKKKQSLLEQQKERFVEGAKENGIDKKTADVLFGKILDFAGYGFNKSHSMAYAFVAYQTAFLKANYPVEYMAALLTSEKNNLDKVGILIEDCRQLKIEVLPPDVSHSKYEFTVEGTAIRFGMGAIKNVGENPVRAIVEAREAEGPFKDIFDFCTRVDTSAVNRRVMESLNKAGAFASTEWNRRQIDEVLDMALSEGQLRQREKAVGQESLFDLMGEDDAGSALQDKPDIPDWPESEILAMEKEMLGLYVSSHPLARHAKVLDAYSSGRAEDLSEMPDGADVVLGGILSNVKRHVSTRGRSKGKTMAFVTLDTLAGPCEITVFSETYEARATLLAPDEVVMITAKVNYRNGEAGLIAQDILPIDSVEKNLTKAIHIRLDLTAAAQPPVDELANILGAQPGECDVYLHCRTSEKNVTVHASEACLVAPSDELRQQVEALLGNDSLWYSGAQQLPQHG
jgi:DNA polymerase-3 subunit alpha